MQLTENDWQLINNIIFEIYQASNEREMRSRFLKSIRFLIPYEKANFFLSSNEDDHYLADSIDVGFPEDYLADYFGNLEKYDFTNWIYASGQNEVFLLSELLTEQEQNESVYFQKYFLPNGIKHAIIFSLSWNGEHVGTVSLFRSRSAENFTTRDKHALSLFKKHLAAYLYKSIHAEAKNTEQPTKDIHRIVSHYRLTMRESEILILLLNGDEPEDICENLFISNNTLRKHMSNIYKKLDINKRSDLNKIFTEI